MFIEIFNFLHTINLENEYGSHDFLSEVAAYINTSIRYRSGTVPMWQLR